MTAATMKIERSGPVIRAALAEFAPDECAQFEAEFQQAIGQVSEKFDRAPLDAVLDRWWGIAAIRADPLSEQERAQVARARDGVFDGLWERDVDGNWLSLGVEGKLSMWRALIEVSDSHAELAATDLAGLAKRAESQRVTLEDHRLQVANGALTR